MAVAACCLSIIAIGYWELSRQGKASWQLLDDDK